MYSKQDIINSLRHEEKLMNHLVDKIPTDKYDWRPSEETRTFRELLEYFIRLGDAPLSLLTEGYNPETMKALRLACEAQDVSVNFKDLFNKQIDLLTDYITNTSEEELNETFSIFGMEQPRKQFFMEIAFKNFPAYRMQLFQYLKAGLGMNNLKTSNLWMGMDS